MFLVGCGGIWQSVTVSGRQWQGQVDSGILLHTVVFFGRLWQEVTVSGTQQKSFADSICLHLTVTVFGRQWHSFADKGSLLHSFFLISHIKKQSGFLMIILKSQWGLLKTAPRTKRSPRVRQLMAREDLIKYLRYRIEAFFVLKV